MKEFLSKYNELRNQKIKQGYSSFSQDEYKSMIREYEIIIDEWEVISFNNFNWHLQNIMLQFTQRTEK